MNKMLHCESIYGFYHGQDPRTLEPDEDCCTEKESEAHRAAVEAIGAEEFGGDKTGSGCHVMEDMIVCTSAFGPGVYQIVMTEEGVFVRDATFEDVQHEGTWTEWVEYE
jgi:hypothetical protein